MSLSSDAKSFSEKLDQIESSLARIGLAEDMAALEALRRELIGRSGSITDLTKQLALLPQETRRELGRRVNDLRARAERELSSKEKELSKAGTEDVTLLDYTLPGASVQVGNLHLLTKTFDELLGVFRDMGFSVVEGPDIEDEWHNFEALRLHADHPARDTQDSFYLAPDRLLKTHTSPMQIRYMEKHRPPIQMVAPGYCFRRDPFTSRHSPVFLQIEALMVDKGITFAHLKGVLTEFTRGFFGRERRVRFRPDFFPFVEPGCELAMDCPFCGGSGCRVCSYSGWIEILGAGMVHPEVLKNCDIDPAVYTGFAFGMGVERPAMIRYGIDDIRHFYENDFRFLEQF